MALGSLIRSFAAPASACQALAWDGRAFWVADAGTDLIYHIDPRNGAVLRTFAAPNDGTRGLAWDPTRGRLWAIDTAAVKIYEIDTLGNIIRSIPAPATFAPGIAHTGSRLYVVENTANKILYILDPIDGTVLRSITIPIGAPTGVSISNSTVWVSDNTTNTVDLLSIDGNTIYTFAAPTTNPQDLAFDGYSMWVIDSDTIYQVSLS